MTGREKIEAAFSRDGAREFAAVIPYEGIYVRDCWSQVTDCPWWYVHESDLDRQLQWRREVVQRLGHDWFGVALGPTRQQRDACAIDVTGEGVFRVDRPTGRRERLRQLGPGEWVSAKHQSKPPCPQSIDEIDKLIPSPGEDLDEQVRQGAADLPRLLLAEFGPSLFPVGYVMAPLWDCSSLWGHEGFFLAMADRPDLVEHACLRQLDLALRRVRKDSLAGAAGIYIEECYMDLISPQAYARYALPALRKLNDEIHSLGMKSVHYFCGNPAGRWDFILQSGADALSLEESKKNFRIDIEEVVEIVDGRCAVLGNLDAATLLSHGSEQALAEEIRRQVRAGRANRSRFAMSLGSPVTPATPLSRVRLFCDLAHELGR